MNSEKNHPTPKPVPEIRVSLGRGSPMGITAKCIGVTKAYRLSFGQGTEVDMQPDDSNAVGKYALYYEPGAYMIYAHNGLAGNKRVVYAARQIVLRGDNKVHVDLEPVVGGKPGEYRLVAQEDGVDAASRYSVDWGDNALSEDERIDQIWLAPGQEFRKVLTNGEHDVKVYDEHGLRERHFEITVDGSVNDTTDPLVTVTRNDSDATGHTVTMELVKVDENKPVIIDWGEDVEDYEQEITTPKKGQKINHKYAGQPAYSGLISYKDGSGVPCPFVLTIPWPKDAAE